MEYFVLNDGNKIPKLAIGPGSVTYNPQAVMKSLQHSNSLLYKIYNKFYIRPKKEKKYVDALAYAFHIGLLHLDYSASYGSGDLIVDAAKKANVKREDIFLTTRVSNHAQRDHKVREEFFSQLKNLQTDYVDLLQFHWPVTDLYLDTWREIITLQKEGYVKSVGVANCHQHHLDAIINAEGIIPAVDQVEVHPLFTNKELIKYCTEKGILIEAYSSLARFDDRLFRLPALKQIAEAHKKSTVQVILRWDIQNGQIPIFRSLNKKRIEENINIFDFELTAEEMAKIDAFNINARVRYDPDNCDFSIL